MSKIIADLVVDQDDPRLRVETGQDLFIAPSGQVLGPGISADASLVGVTVAGTVYTGFGWPALHIGFFDVAPPRAAG